MRIFVVGGAGFIGSHLVDRLLAEGHHVDVIDDLSSGSLGNLAEARSSGGALKIHHLDCASRVMASLVGIRRPDVIFNLAVLPRGGESSAEEAAGLQRCLNVLEAAREFNVNKVIVTPAMHKVHHSRWQPETDSNYSAFLSVWDRVFRSFRRREALHEVELGLAEFDDDAYQSVAGMLKTPLASVRKNHLDG